MWSQVHGGVYLIHMSSNQAEKNSVDGRVFFCPNTNPNHESPSCFRVAITEILPGKMVLNGQEVIFETYCV